MRAPAPTRGVHISRGCRHAGCRGWASGRIGWKYYYIGGTFANLAARQRSSGSPDLRTLHASRTPAVLLPAEGGCLPAGGGGSKEAVDDLWVRVFRCNFIETTRGNLWSINFEAEETKMILPCTILKFEGWNVLQIFLRCVVTFWMILLGSI